MCPHCRAFITDSDKVCPYCNERVGPRYAERARAADVIGGFIPAARFNTMLILLINAGLYVATALYSMKAGVSSGFGDIDARVLYAFGAKIGLRYMDGQWWRLVTAGFLHGGILHILMNSWVLFDLGAQVEAIYGAARMWVIYFVATIGGFYVSALLIQKNNRRLRPQERRENVSRETEKPCLTWKNSRIIQSHQWLVRVLSAII